MSGVVSFSRCWEGLRHQAAPRARSAIPFIGDLTTVGQGRVVPGEGSYRNSGGGLRLAPVGSGPRWHLAPPRAPPYRRRYATDGLRRSAPAPRRPPTFMSRALPVLLLSLLVLSAPAEPLTGQQADGFLPVRVDTERNRLLLEIPAERMGVDFLYMNTLATGMGTSPPLMDRGQVGMEAVVRLEERGGRVVMIRDNWAVRAPGSDSAGERAAREAFPFSVIASFPVDSAATRTAGRTVVDASSFFFSDVFGVADRLRNAGQGTSRVERERSWIDEDHTGAFPRNTEVRAVLTFVGDSPGASLQRAAPDGSAATFQQHHSMVELPPLEGFRPRPFDTRAGLFSTSFFDFSQGIDGTYRDAFANRWRLVPSDPAAYLRGELVDPVEPIVYHMDPGIPEPYRTAFIEGGMWWNEIFEAAGFRNAFQILDLPEGADPLDARYNVVYWVHRAQPGPSVGPSFRDPRTGEILKTVVRMDSYRSLVDYNIYAGLLPAAGPAGLNVDAQEFTMARRRQHTAHEIGHTLGLAHNFIAGSQGRSSVMDYPAPLIDLDADGRLDLRDAYRDSGGAWDTLAIRYGYAWYPDQASEAQGLAGIVEGALADGLRFITGGHAGSAGSVPGATQWVEGSDMFQATERTTRVRRLLVDRFSEEAIRPGEPMSMLNMRFAHVYLHHRYALEGVVKYVGGMDFTYALRGDGQTPTRVLPAAEQRRALRMVMAALSPGELAVPTRVAELIPPTPYGFDGSESWLGSAAGPAFDPLTLAGGLATEIVGNLLHRERAARLVLFHARDPGNPSLDEVLSTLVEGTWGAAAQGDAGARTLQRAVQRVVADALMDLGGDSRALPEVRAVTDLHLDGLRERIRGASGGGAEDRGHRAAVLRDLDRYFAGEDDPAARSRFPVVPLPWP